MYRRFYSLIYTNLKKSGFLFSGPGFPYLLLIVIQANVSCLKLVLYINVSKLIDNIYQFHYQY